MSDLPTDDFSGKHDCISDEHDSHDSHKPGAQDMEVDHDDDENVTREF